MNALPQIVRKDGPSVEHTKDEKAYAYRVEAKTQRKVEQRNRTQDVELQNKYKLVNLEKDVLQADFKKQRVTFKKRIVYYNKTMADLNDLKIDKGKSKTFLTEVGASLDISQGTDGRQTSRLAFDLQAIGSIRRRTNPIHGVALVGRALADLRRLQRKHIQEYDEAMETLHSLERETGLSVNAKIPRRSYTPPLTANLSIRPPAYILHLRRQVAAMEKELKELENKRLRRDGRPKTAPNAADNSSLSDELQDVVITQVSEGAYKCNSLQDKKMVKFDIDTLKGSLITGSSYIGKPEMIANPFGDGILPESTRSRLLREVGKDDRMYVWLGFHSHEEMLQVLSSKDGRVSQIPVALLHILEDGDGEPAEALDNMVETDSEVSSDGEEAKFKIFDEFKVHRRKRKTKLRHTIQSIDVT